MQGLLEEYGFATLRNKKSGQRVCGKSPKFRWTHVPTFPTERPTIPTGSRDKSGLRVRGRKGILKIEIYSGNLKKNKNRQGSIE